MEKSWVFKDLITTFNATGAVRAAQMGYTVMIVDVIDMSTSLEAALQEGAAFVYGASPDNIKAPVKVNPYKIGFSAGMKAKEMSTGVIIISEPRWGSDIERENNCKKVLKGILASGASIEEIVPNLGAEVAKITNFKEKVVICVSHSGGVAFDAAWQFTTNICTGTIARTLKLKGKESAEIAVKRVLGFTNAKGIAVVAASSNSIEDLLAVQYISQLIIESGYLKI